MTNIKKEIERLRDASYRAYAQSGVLTSIITEKNESNTLLAEELHKLVGGLERATLQARNLDEFCFLDNEGTGKKPYHKQWPGAEITGRVEVDSNNWLHIQLNTLLPHCKYKASPYIQDTIVRLLSAYRRGGGKLPFYTRAMLIIDEHCDVASRQVYDQDNKGWKSIPNALKGLVVADDDQFSMGITLISTWDTVPACHIYIMDMADAGAFFSFHLGECGSFFR